MNSNLNQISELSSALNQKNSGLSTKLAQLKLCGITLLAGALIASCSSSTATAPDNNANLSNSLTLEKAATVPVLDGKVTQTGIYVRNNTGHSISGIQYASVAGAGQHASSLQLSTTNCTSIAANSSCLLGFTTPSLSLGQSGSSLIDASYNGQHSKQLINYRYYSSDDYTGVNFSDGSTSLYGTNDYATVYAFVGKGQSQTQVGFNASNSSLAVSSGLTNASVDIASNQVVALEIKSNQDVTSNLVSLTPYTRVSSKQLAKSLQSANLQNRNLQVSISPTQQANLLMSDSPILNATAESTATITLINNGNQTATNITLSSADSAKVSITAATSNPCTSGGSLVAGASCNYKLNLVDLYNNGSTSLNLTYNNSRTSINSSQTVDYYNNLAAPMVSIVPTSSSFTEGINTANSLVFNVQNIGNAPLNNLSVSLSKTLTQATLSQTNDCGAQIKAKASCTITTTVSANANIDSGIFYAKLNGNFTNGATITAYSFISKPVSTTITDSTIATISSTTPQNAALSVIPSTSIALSFSKAMNPTTLNATNIQLQLMSNSSSIPLTFQGVTNNNQTVTFTQTSGKLSDLTNYKIVINPSALLDHNGNAMGQASTQIAASFTTGDSVAPTIVTVNPTNGAESQSKTPTINITFSESMNPATLTSSNITLKTGDDITVDGTSITISNNNQTATVNLNATQLTDNTDYKLVLNQNALTDVSGNPLGNNLTYPATTFTTGDFTAPTLSSTIPLNGATEVAVESPISLTFSESMNTSTLTTTTVKLQKVVGSSDVSLNAPSFSNGNKTVTFQPSASLSAGESYNIVLNQTLIADVSGNKLGLNSALTVSTFATLQTSSTNFMLGGENGLLGFISSTSSSVSERVAPSANYSAVAKSAAGNYIAVGQNGSIMVSDSNAANWAPVTSGITETLSAVSCGSSNCVAVGSNGKIIYSSNNGQTWSIAASGVTASLASVSCGGSNCLTIVSGSSNIFMLRSLDGGQTWGNATPNGFTNGFNSVSCTSSYCVASVTGYYTGGSFTTRNVFFRTTDWGNTWNVYAPTNSDTSGSGGYTGVSCSGENCLSSIAAFGVTVYSSDGGINWVQQRDATANIGSKLSCTTNYCIAQDLYSSNLLKTTNFGSSWTNITTGASQSLSGFQCNSTNCMAVGNSSIAMLSTDSGGSWITSNAPPTTSGSISRIACGDHTHCIAIGPILISNQNTAIMRTADAGVSWSVIDSGIDAQLGDVSCYGSNCMTITSSSVLYSSDNGQTWNNVTPIISAGNTLVAVNCSNSTCVAGGYDSSSYAPFAMYSSNNGTTWLSSTSIQSIDFLPSYAGSLSCNGNICNYVGTDINYTSGVLLRSTDGGITWNITNIPADFIPIVISCSGANCASLGNSSDYANFKVISSTDNGLNWTLSSWALTAIGFNLNSIACGRTNCIIGGGTTIIQSNNSGLDWGNQINQSFGSWNIYAVATY